MNMSFEELNQFRVRDFLETFDIFTGKSNTNKTNSNQSNIKQADQSDINNLLS